MPQIRKQWMPKQLMRHFLLRMNEREISAGQLTLFSNWIDTNPTVPDGRWFKTCSGLIVCGEGELVKHSSAPANSPKAPKSSKNSKTPN